MPIAEGNNGALLMPEMPIGIKRWPITDVIKLFKQGASRAGRKLKIIDLSGISKQSR